MLCQNCGKNEVNFRYTQVINGVKKEMALCDKCAKELGVYHMDFSMPISMSSFLGDMLSEYASESFLPSFNSAVATKCNSCKTNYDEFIESGLLGCEDCYDVFTNKIDALLKNIHGSNRHVGRISKFIENDSKLEKNNSAKKEEKENKKAEKAKIEELKERLNKAIKEERYEDAAKLRDEIKKEEKNK